MKKLLIFGVLVVSLFSLTGCGKNERIDNAADQAIEFQMEAKESVDEHNQEVQKLENSAKAIEEEIE